MGYYTAHTLIVNCNCKDEEAIIADFRNSNENAKRALNEHGNTENEISWWNSEDDLKEFSMKYPRALFEMTGNGSDAGGDYWILYVRDGKAFKTIGKITYPKYSPRKLK